MVALNASNGDYYDCLTGSWFKISGGGGGSGTVTNIATTAPIGGGPITTTGTLTCTTCTTNAAALTSNAVVLGGGGQAAATNTAFTTNGHYDSDGGRSCWRQWHLSAGRDTSGTATLTAPAVAGTAGNPVLSSNAIQLPDGTKALPALRLTTSADGWYRGSTLANSLIYASTTVDAFALGPARR